MSVRILSETVTTQSRIFIEITDSSEIEGGCADAYTVAGREYGWVFRPRSFATGNRSWTFRSAPKGIRRGANAPTHKET